MKTVITRENTYKIDLLLGHASFLKKGLEILLLVL